MPYTQALASTPSHEQSSALMRAVLLTRNLLPFVILLVVVAYEEWFVPLGDDNFQHVAHLAFYGVAGPLVTFFVIQWIAQGVADRERADQELRTLYAELQASHERMEALQELMRSLADSQSESDLETLLDAAVRGTMKATGAVWVGIALRGEMPSSDLPSAELRREEGAGGRYPVSEPLGHEPLGELSLSFAEPPSSDTRQLIAAIGVEVGHAVSSAQRRSRDLLTLFEVDQSIRAERNMRRLLSRVTGTIASRVQASARAAFLSDQDGVLRLEYAHLQEGSAQRGDFSPANFNPADFALPDFVRRVAEGGLPVVASAQEAGELFAGCVSALGLPMRDEEGLVGVLVLGGSESLEHERTPLLALLASQATLAVRNARAYLYSEELAIGEERSRIAREIHDGVAQSLAFCALQLDIVGRQIPKDPAKAAQGVKEASNLLREQIREVRRSIFALRPIDLERYGLLETLRRYVTDFGEQHGIKASLEVGGEIHLAPGDEAVIFRIVQESLNNVAKHARAGQVVVTLQGGERSVALTIQDDGQGFDPQAVSGRVSSAGGLGLTQMRERIESRGGRYRVESTPGQGTRVEASLPQG